MIRYYSILLVFVVWSQSVLSIDLGKQPYKNFSHRDYSGHFQNWAVVQDTRGFIYVANNNGVLEFDGNSWRTISINGLVARCLDVDNYGRIWVGAQDDFGYLAPDSSGTLVFKSLKYLASDICPPIGLVRQVYATSEGVFFSTNSCIIRINGLEVKTYTPKTIFHRTYNVLGYVFTVQPDVGLTMIKGDTLELVPAGERFSNARIYAMMPYDNRKILIATQSDGMFLYDASYIDDPIDHDASSFLIPFTTKNDKFLSDNWVYWGEVLSNNRFAFGTYRGGAVIIDKEGEVVQYIGKSEGIQDETVWHLAADDQDNIWLALNNGVSFSSIKSPITTWDENSAPQGIIQSVKRVGKTLYTSTNTGVYLLDQGKFQKVEGILDLSWDIMPVVSSDGKQNLLIATGNGIYEVNGDRAKLIRNGGVPLFHIYKSKYHKDVLFLGLYDGLGVAMYRNGQWEFIGKFKGIDGRIWRVEEDSEQNIWFVLRHQGVVKAKVDSPLTLQFSNLELFDSIIHNPPFDEDTRLMHVDSKLMLSAPTGLYYFNKNDNQFKPDSSLGPEFVDGSTGIKLFVKDDFGYLWFESYSRSYVRSIARAKIMEDGSFLLLPAELNEIPQMIFSSVDTDSAGVTWIAGSDGLYRFDPSVSMRGIRAPKVYVRKVLVDNDKLLFGGAYSKLCPDGYYSCIDVNQVKSSYPKIPYSKNNVALYFSSPMFGQGGKMLYSHMLKGFDTDWSAWSSTNYKEYTNLPYGKYTFQVKAMSIYEVESPVVNYSFEVGRPWYRHTLMYMLYIVSAGLIVVLSVAIKTRMLKLSNQRLQGLVDERTREILQHQQDIVVKNNELILQKEEIETQRDELDHRNKQTKASIEYAQTIQQAILPTLDLLNKHFESFIFFQPKDVVSGDFYWFTQVVPSDGMVKQFFAVVDCTGHGVPGAFMSMIGNRMLSEIVNERRIYSPATILATLNEMLNNVLKQDTNESFDGMDVSLCSIEHITAERYLVTFAGANRPLAYHRQGATSLSVIRGSRKSIGGILPDVDRGFDNHLLDLVAGDTLIFFTDGFSDQNNQFGRKFTTPKLYSLLMSHIHQPMSEIGEELKVVLDSHKGPSSQRDDITVVGLRLK
jgi:serine phosphatase RsbU (regulator of sigma subunit)/ligand-binding sensor domain-containing protein